MAASGPRKAEAMRAQIVSCGSAKKGNHNEGIQDGYFPHMWRRSRTVSRNSGENTARIDSDALSRDLHQDHRLVSELTWNTFRNHMILEYEIVKYDATLVCQFFCSIDRAYCAQKIQTILDCFQDPERQELVYRRYIFFDLRLRGVESIRPLSMRKHSTDEKMVY